MDFIDAFAACVDFNSKEIALVNISNLELFKVFTWSEKDDSFIKNINRIYVSDYDQAEYFKQYFENVIISETLPTEDISHLKIAWNLAYYIKYHADVSNMIFDPLWERYEHNCKFGGDYSIPELQ